jgi:serine/threonine protein kinase
VSAAESTGFTPPAAFGPYRVLHQIGSGVLGPVFRTYDPQNDRLVAVKAFRLEIVPEDVARLAESLRRLPSAGLSHPGIVNAIDAGLEGMSAFLALEYVSAETLDVALRHLAPSPLDRAVPLINDIAEAIEAAWASGQGHGSLHPRDVFIASGTNEVRVTGFGVGPALEAAGIKVPPRRPYTAPERSTGGAWDIRADLYSLGAIAHELLTKRRPGGAGEQDGSLVTGTTPEQRRLIRGVLGAALADSPEHRFHSPRAFANALSAIAKGEPVGPLPEGPAPIAEPKDEPKPESKIESVVEAPRAVAVEEPKRPARGRSQVPVAKPAPLFAAIESPAPTPAPEALLAPDPPADTLQAFPSEGPVEEKTLVIEPAVIAARVPPQPPAPAPVAHHVEIQHVAPISPHVSSMFGREPEPAPTPATPWAAYAVIFIAGIFLGGVGGYWGGMHRAGVSSSPAVAAPASAPTSAGAQTPSPIPPGTDVSVPSEPASSSATKPAPEPAQTPAAATSGKLVVRSATADATVKIDGRARGRAPVTVGDLPFGTHTVEVSHAGFVTRTERVTLTVAAASKTLSLDLQAAAPAAAGAGSVFLDSRPSGARVFLDGKDAGKTAVTLSDIKAGPHKLRFELAGYKTLDTTITIRAGQQERVTVTLEQMFRNNQIP